MNFHSSLTAEKLAEYWNRQLSHLFDDGNPVTDHDALEITVLALERVNDCFSANEKKYFRSGDRVEFHHLHSDQYSMFLYLASNVANNHFQPSSAAEKLYLLNKTLHGIDALFSVELPRHFSFTHPLGTVLGRASYGDFFAVYQGCTVGSTSVERYPSLGTGVVMYANSSVIGACKIGENVVIGAGALVIETDIPSNTVVLGRTPNLRIIDNSVSTTTRAFGPSL